MTCFLDSPNARPLPTTDALRDDVIAAMRRHGGTATCRELAVELGRAPASVRNAIGKLIAQGRVARLGLRASTSRAPARFRIVPVDSERRP